jgi:hypothetical protein
VLAFDQIDPRLSPGQEGDVDAANIAINAAVITLVGSLIALVLARAGRGEFDVVNARLEGIEAQFEAIGRRFDAQDQGIDRLEQRLEHRIDVIQASVGSMRSDLTQVALAVGVRPRATNG